MGSLSAFRRRVSGVHFSRAGRWSQFLLTAFADGLSWGWRGEGPSAAPLAGLSLVGRAGRGSRAPSVGHEPHCRRAGARVLGCSPAPARADCAAAGRDSARVSPASRRIRPRHQMSNSLGEHSATSPCQPRETSALLALPPFVRLFTAARYFSVATTFSLRQGSKKSARNGHSPAPRRTARTCSS